MIKYYSQNGEDYILHELFKGKPDGFFVEVGCIDGKRFSNTLVFEEMGWKGLCVEAHNDYIGLLKKNRPNSIVCHCAVGEKNEKNVNFYANSRGSLSTLDKSKEEEFKNRFGSFFTGFKKQIVQKRTLNSIFEEYHISEIDILSIDIEGSEVEAIKGLNFDRYKPKVIVAESDDSKHEEKLDRILLKNGYSKSIRIANNIFYILNKKAEILIKKKKFAFTVVHTQHPLDNSGIIEKKINLEFTKKEKKNGKRE